MPGFRGACGIAFVCLRLLFSCVQEQLKTLTKRDLSLIRETYYSKRDLLLIDKKRPITDVQEQLKTLASDLLTNLEQVIEEKLPGGFPSKKKIIHKIGKMGQ